MAKGQQRSNREAKKPKQQKTKIAGPVTTASGAAAAAPRPSAPSKKK